MAKDEAKTVEAAMDFLNSEAGQGYDGMGADQFAPVFINILHSTAPEQQEGTPEYVPGAKFGDFFNSMTRKSYGKSIEVVPLKCEEAWLEWAPNNGGLRGRHAPGSIKVTGDPYGKQFTDSGNEIIEYMMFYVLVVGEFENGVAVFSLKKSGMKHGKTWNTRIRSVKLPNGAMAPYYSSVWKLTSMLNKNDKAQTWYNIGVGKTTGAERVRFITPDDLPVIKTSREQVVSSKGISLAAIEGGSTLAITDNNAEY